MPHGDSAMTLRVVVVGGGPEGLRSAIAQAEKGNQVYLIESGPSLVAEVDILARIDEFKDRIQVLTLTGLESSKEKDGRFVIKLKKRASRVIAELCNGCDDCARVCPATLVDASGAEMVVRTAIDSATPGGKGYNILREIPPCQEACPVHLDVRGYVGLAADGKYRESLNLIRQRLPFPGVIGRICTRPCEGVCSRGLADEPVAICALKRFVADRERNETRGDAPADASASGPATGKRVAVVGSGPAGLTCAYELARKGHHATVFESLPVIGGMLRVGIPEYRLPRDILEEEVALVRRSGVEFRTGITLGRDITLPGLLGGGFDAVFVAIGAHKGQWLGVPGEGGSGVTNGVDFLRELNLGNKPKVGKKTVVVGGGNVAIDSARSAKRLGSGSVTVVYRRSRAEMPAHKSEVDAAMPEGIDIIFLAAPVEVLLDQGKVRGLRCRRMELGLPDKTGRRSPVPVQESEFDLEADTVITAIGQSVDGSAVKAGGLAL
ncbi:MAG: FAD-dependent oxidoreductase, partial [Dehalococcoidia bacterium]|nr:FAD-dependent oxidoreductase [Dehalococcoidia bacterium]